MQFCIECTNEVQQLGLCKECVMKFDNEGYNINFTFKKFCEYEQWATENIPPNFSTISSILEEEYSMEIQEVNYVYKSLFIAGYNLRRAESNFLYYKHFQMFKKIKLEDEVVKILDKMGKAFETIKEIAHFFDKESNVRGLDKTIYEKYSVIGFKNTEEMFNFNIHDILKQLPKPRKEIHDEVSEIMLRNATYGYAYRLAEEIFCYHYLNNLYRRLSQYSEERLNLNGDSVDERKRIKEDIYSLLHAKIENYDNIFYTEGLEAPR